MSKRKTFDPLKLARITVKKITGENKDFTDKPLIPITKIRPDKDKDGKVTSLSVDVFGCNLRCVHCWILNASLAANFNAPKIQKKLRGLPKDFRQGVCDAQDLAEYLVNRLKKYTQKGSITLTGGETTLYRGGIKTIAEHIKKQREDFSLNLETHGITLANVDKYLDALDGLQDTITFYVSAKGMDEDSFEQFTGGDGKHKDDAFIAIEKLLKNGFLATPGGVVTNIFEELSELENPENAIAKLHTRLSAIHPDLPRTIAFHKVDFANVQDRQELKKKWEASGYGKTSPRKVEGALIKYFAAQGTPIIMADNNTKVKGTQYQRTKTVLKKIIKDLQSQRKIPQPKSALQKIPA